MHFGACSPFFTFKIFCIGVLFITILTGINATTVPAKTHHCTSTASDSTLPTCPVHTAIVTQASRPASAVCGKQQKAKKGKFPVGNRGQCTSVLVRAFQVEICRQGEPLPAQHPSPAATRVKPAPQQQHPSASLFLNKTQGRAAPLSLPMSEQESVQGLAGTAASLHH